MMETKESEELLHDLEFIFPIISGKVSMAINRVMLRNFRFSGLDITPEQWTILAHLWKEEGITQQRLCDVTFKDKPSMTRLIDNLEKLGLVERRSDPKDRRSNLIYLTPKGIEIRPQVEEALLKTMETTVHDIDELDMDKARSILKAVFNNMEEALKDR